MRIPDLGVKGGRFNGSRASILRLHLVRIFGALAYTEAICTAAAAATLSAVNAASIIGL